MKPNVPTPEDTSLPLRMAYEDTCSRSDGLDNLEHSHLNTWQGKGALFSVLCGLTIPVTAEQIRHTDRHCDSIFSNGHTYRKAQSLGNAALTIWLCTGERVDSCNPALRETTTREKRRPFKVISTARQARVLIDDNHELTVGVIRRSCEGKLVNSDGEQLTFNPEIDRATLVTVAEGNISIASLMLKPKLQQIYDERDLSTCDMFGKLVGPLASHDPYLAFNAILDRAIDAQSLRMEDF